MKPKTRSATAKASSSKDKLPNTNDSEEDPVTSIESHLNYLRKNFRELKKEVLELRTKNEDLTRELEKAREDAVDNEAQPKRGKKAGPTVASLQKEIAALKTRIEICEKTEKKDKRLIRQLQQKELKKEAAELQEDTEDGLETDDSMYRLRKLLRHFSNLMSANSLEGSEECPICMEQLKVDDSVSFPCQHIICKDCYKQLALNNDDVMCPACRATCPRDDIEVVRYTASSQWDELLKVAAKAALIDHRRIDDTSEEEDEDNFLDNEESEAVSGQSAGEQASEHLLSSSPEPEGTLPVLSTSAEVPKIPKKKRVIATPDVSSDTDLKEEDIKQEPDQSDQHDARPSNGAVREPSYAQAPAVDKRRKLEELAEARALKRQKR